MMTCQPKPIYEGEMVDLQNEMEGSVPERAAVD